VRQLDEGNMTIAFDIPGPPCAKGRPRIGINRGTGRAMAFTDRKTENYEGLVCMAAQAARPPAPLTGPLAVSVVAVFARPAYLLARSKRTNALLKGVEGRMPHTGRPDLDNVIKAVVDGMNRAGVWGDDSQIGDLTARKAYAATGELPHVEVVIRQVVDVLVPAVPGRDAVLGL